MAGITLITGGMRSGKSAQALKIAEGYQRKLFIATAEPVDGEMKERIARHKKERDQTYTTVEEPIEVAPLLSQAKSRYGVDMVVLDCLTLWMGNLFHYRLDSMGHYVEGLIEALSKVEVPTVVVTNEIGMGVVPPSKETRRFVDECGRLNAKVAAIAREVIFMVSGMPLYLKKE